MEASAQAPSTWRGLLCAATEPAKPPRPIGSFAVGFRAPWPIQIATKKPFNEENGGACCRCKNSGYLGETAPPYKKYRYFPLKIPVFGLKKCRFYPKTQILFFDAKIRNKTRLWLPPWPLWLCHNRRGGPETQQPPGRCGTQQKRPNPKICLAAPQLQVRFLSFLWAVLAQISSPRRLGVCWRFFAPNCPNL